jgi:hypothetical protein
MAGLRADLRHVIRVEAAAGPESIDGRTTVTPLARTAVIGGGLFSLSWPSAVEVSSAEGRSRIPIFDTTRWAQLAIALITLSALLTVGARARERKERQ